MAAKFNPDFTPHVLALIGPKTTPRNKEVLGALIKHIHDFTREVELSVEEWTAGVEFINSIGQASTPIRNEGLRMSDVIGLETYVFSFAFRFLGHEFKGSWILC